MGESNEISEKCRGLRTTANLGKSRWECRRKQLGGQKEKVAHKTSNDASSNDASFIFKAKWSSTLP